MNRTIVILLFMCSAVFGQIRITEVMFDPVGAERTDEFVELFNAGTTAVNLDGWFIGDSVSVDLLVSLPGFGLTVQPGQFAVILDPDYIADSSRTYESIIPAAALRLTFETATFGSNGLSNSAPETVVLINALSDTIDAYRYSTDNLPGFSDERRNPLSDEWENSRSLNGTPGKTNSVSPKAIDLALTRFDFQTGDFVQGLDFPFTVRVKNLGEQTIDNYTLTSFFDTNRNGAVEPAEIVENYPQLQSIASGDSVELSGTFRNVGFGEWDFGVSISTPGDADSSNNIIVKTIFVDDPGAVDLAINEIQFAPETGFDEWIELANFGNSEINLRQLFFADSRDTVLISEEDRWLSPGELVVLAGDSAAAFQYNFPVEKLIVVRGFPGLNNDIESLRVLGPSFATYDFVPYTSEWFGRDVNRGTTLEKIRPEFNGQIATSWAASVAASGSTPAATNSVQIDLTVTGESIDFSPNPFSPDSDGFEDFCIIRYRLDVATAIANVRIFDLKGRLVRHIANHEPVGSQGQFIWDGKSDDGRLMPIGSYVVYFQILNTEKRITREFVKSVVLFKR